MVSTRFAVLKGAMSYQQLCRCPGNTRAAEHQRYLAAEWFMSLHACQGRSGCTGQRLLHWQSWHSLGCLHALSKAF